MGLEQRFEGVVLEDYRLQECGDKPRGAGRQQELGEVRVRGWSDRASGRRAALPALRLWASDIDFELLMPRAVRAYIFAVLFSKCVLHFYSRHRKEYVQILKNIFITALF